MNQAIIIRQAALTDLNQILEIENDAFNKDAFSRAQMSYLICRAKGVFYVAESQGSLAGYISMNTNQRHNTGRIYSIAVSSAHRKKGVAGLLMDKALDFARDNGLNSVFLEVRTDNNAAIRLYENKGFIKRSIKKCYYKDGADAFSMVCIRMNKSLTS